ncbi:MAG TPA: S-adenosylmethionine:tRNA ribosyltransferase-isomerase [Jatrophihabitans sp.]|jgi:S-adenosylmethionine:tRNA ribosyltransferase-isomerase|uniref:S-adenosylmethionine:tRNA ribosyltransferase-isomerase n=1 Tax=Jatrophihabitans sp. TaxID=1932789 RepID=UPI002DF766E9|nr:S-adenosylmethionine:tRNA ribosyltransferase-isomerase [Jatrophihabitans sp.]
MTFALPDGLEASAPPTARDGVRLLVAHEGGIEHSRFSHLADFLSPGDLVVVNTSGTLAAAIDGTRTDGTPVTVHFSAALDDGSRVVELRPRGDDVTGPLPDVTEHDVVTLPDGVRLVVLEPHPAGQARLWRAAVPLEGGVAAYLERHGRPIRYAYVPRAHPLADYQTVFGREAGSAEMPSAGRPFTSQLVTELVSRGIGVAPITLHTGVSSQDAGEPPQPEPYRVPGATARQVNLTRAWGGRVVAVGTTVTRALESAVDPIGVVRERRGWTDLVLGAEHPARVVDGLITGWHVPGASHLMLLEAVAGAPLVERAYAEAVRARYLWHEFGDSCLLLP